MVDENPVVSIFLTALVAFRFLYGRWKQIVLSEQDIEEIRSDSSMVDENTV